MITCEKCKSHGLRFHRKYAPQDYFHGDPNSKVWVVGINPSGTIGRQGPQGSTSRIGYFKNLETIHAYFKNFSRVSERIFKGFNQGTVGHTDIVKCYSPKFPPDGKTRTEADIVDKCAPYLFSQVARYKPKVIICNGATACRELVRLVQPLPGEDHETHYFGELEGLRLAIVLSGFIGRIDNYARRRLGKEIEALLDEMGIAV